MSYLRIKNTVLLLALLAVSFVRAQGSINESQSYVEFDIENNGEKVKGKIPGISGMITFNEDNLETASFNVTIPVKNIRTGNSIRDKHLMESDFFYQEKFPEIQFKSSQVEKKESGYLLRGVLSLHGISKEINIYFNYSENQFNGKLLLNRMDFEIGDDESVEGMSNKVNIRINCVLKA